MPLFTKLQPKTKHRDSETCLLLDTSGSMSSCVTVADDPESPEQAFVEEPRRIDLLFKAVHETPECAGLKMYEFNSFCRPLEVIPSLEAARNFDPHGGTNLADAFTTAKAAGFYNAILITDGEPDSESAALHAALGMRLGIIYIGNPPMPRFLQKLARETDGTFAIADLRDQKAITDAIVHALPSPEMIKDPTKGPINL